MERIKNNFGYILGILIILSLPGYVSAEEDLSFSFWGQVSPFVSGSAGSGPGSPDFSDIFDASIGFGGELSKRYSDNFSSHVGAGFERASGNNYEGISFSDLEIIPVYVGGKYQFESENAHWRPYLRMDIGAAHLSSVDTSYQGLKDRYWDSSWEFLFDLGAGVEYRGEQWRLFFDVKYRYIGEPDAALGEPSKADALQTMPVTFGVN